MNPLLAVYPLPPKLFRVVVRSPGRFLRQLATGLTYAEAVRERERLITGHAASLGPWDGVWIEEEAAYRKRRSKTPQAKAKPPKYSKKSLTLSHID